MILRRKTGNRVPFLVGHLPGVAGTRDGGPVGEEVTAITGTTTRCGDGESGKLGARGGLGGNTGLRCETSMC